MKRHFLPVLALMLASVCGGVAGTIPATSKAFIIEINGSMSIEDGKGSFKTRPFNNQTFIEAASVIRSIPASKLIMASYYDTANPASNFIVVARKNGEIVLEVGKFVGGELLVNFETPASAKTRLIAGASLAIPNVTTPLTGQVSGKTSMKLPSGVFSNARLRGAVAGETVVDGWKVIAEFRLKTLDPITLTSPGP